uniref:Uncharacterized protein n=1 Tax=Cacopsylla melanoneura TaxID=428564 RepID=A0A8D8YU68_9HEMI
MMGCSPLQGPKITRGPVLGTHPPRPQFKNCRLELESFASGPKIDRGTTVESCPPGPKSLKTDLESIKKKPPSESHQFDRGPILGPSPSKGPQIDKGSISQPSSYSSSGPQSDWGPVFGPFVRFFSRWPGGFFSTSRVNPLLPPSSFLS